MMSEELLVPPPLAITDVRYVGDPVAIVDRREPLPGRGRVRADRGRLRPAQTASSTTPPPPPTPRTSCTRAGASSRTRWWRCRSRRSPPTSTRRSQPPRTSSSATSSRTATSACRWRPAASSRRGTRGRDELDIVCATQSVHETRNFFARYLQIPEGNVHVTARDVGGGFGQKMFVYREECAVVLASTLLGRPVKWIEDRRENLLSAPHSRNEFGHGEDGPRRRRDHPGDHRRHTCATSAPTRCARP